MTVWELICELTRYDADDEVTIRLKDQGEVEEFEAYEVYTDRVSMNPYIEAR